MIAPPEYRMVVTHIVGCKHSMQKRATLSIAQTSDAGRSNSGGYRGGILEPVLVRVRVINLFGVVAYAENLSSEGSLFGRTLRENLRQLPLVKSSPKGAVLSV
jgi:hypothetical protein